MDKRFEKASRILEFNKILEQLETYTSSVLAKELVKEVQISTSLAEINKRLDETSEAVSLLVKKGEPPLFGICDIHPMMKRAQMGGGLSAKALLEVSDFLRVARYLKSYLKREEKEDADISVPMIQERIQGLYANRELEEKINSSILSEEEISDAASTQLASIRRNIRKKQDGIREKLNSVLSSERDYLQDTIVTMREGRYVVPVKQEFKSRVKGLIHDISSSGATVYIEPMSVVNLNNELKSLFLAEREEIERILFALTEKVAQVSYEIDANQEILAELDFIFAKGKFSLEQECNRPQVNGKKYIDLKSARHPLLEREIAVPIDIYLGDEFTSLIITGPNTGGKTVTLKTVGISVLMTQYGLHIPATESSQVGVFQHLFADIGDEQSIKQSLSTFSSHMVNIVEILEKADTQSLVLFDELGAGTDPMEGASLAHSIMDYMLKNQICCISTTHYNQLKIYALTTPKVANASMEFDVDTLSPTYRLLIGIPGKSNAFEISKRLGLSEEIINHAKEFVSEDNIEFEKVLQSIEEDRSRIEQHRYQAQKAQLELEQQNKKLEREIEKLKNSREKVMEEARSEANRLLQRTKENMDLILSEIAELKDSLDSQQARKLQEAQDLYRETFQSVDKSKPKLKIEKAVNPIENIKIGDRVRTSLGAEGNVLELPDSKGNVLVQVGIMKMKLPKNSLVRAETSEVEKSQNKTRQIMKNKAKNITTELDLRGKNYEDAKAIVEKYLDDAYLSGLKSVRLIHGKGTGVLRKKIREYLRKYKHVKNYQDAAYNEGGDGVTVVELK